MASSILRSSFKTILTFAIVVLILISIHLSNISSSRKVQATSNAAPPRTDLLDKPFSGDPDAPECQRLKGGEDVVVAMRTGATEIKDKLPIHFETTFRCYQNTLIFSDYAEKFEGHQVHDVLAPVAAKFQEASKFNADFRHYHHLQDVGREGLSQEELHGESLESGPVGKNDNPGWRLDKWKFLPMMVETLKLQPDKKWYVFVEPDTFLVWSNLLLWLQKLDPSKAKYYGSEVQIGPDIFAHGGTGFVMSKPAIEAVADLYLKDQDAWHKRTSEHWAGDCILGTALKQAGVSLTWTWPMFQGGNPADLEWDGEKGDWTLWCTPSMSYHHFGSYEVQSMWGYEQNRIREQQAEDWHATAENPQILYHKEVFHSYVLPNITNDRDNWTNDSPDVMPNTRGLRMDQCREICEGRTTCMQYSLGPKGCSVGETFHMGSLADRMQSGWMYERVEKWSGTMKDCKKSGWLVAD